MLREAKMPRIVGEASPSPLNVSGPMMSVGLDRIPNSVTDLGVTVGGNVPYYGGRGIPRRINVKFAIPAITQSFLNVSTDLQVGDAMFIRLRKDKDDYFWIKTKSEVIDSGDFGDKRHVWGMSIRTLNKLIHQRSLTDEYENITPMSVAKEFVYGGVVHTDVSEQSDGSFRVLSADWTNDNVQLRNIFAGPLQSDDNLGFLYTRCECEEVQTIINPDGVTRTRTFNTFKGKRVYDVVRVLPYVLRPEHRHPRQNLTVEHRVDDLRFQQPTSFVLIGNVIRRKPIEMLGSRPMPHHAFRRDYYETTRLEFGPAAYDDDFAASALITNIEARLTMV